MSAKDRWLVIWAMACLTAWTVMSVAQYRRVPVREDRWTTCPARESRQYIPPAGVPPVEP